MYTAMKRYNYFQAIPLAFYSRALYRDVRHTWNGLGFTYLFLLIALALIPVAFLTDRMLSTIFNVPEQSTSLVVTTEAGKYVSEDIMAVINQIPDMTLKNGRLTLNSATSPHTIVSPDTQEPFIIIDLSLIHI